MEESYYATSLQNIMSELERIDLLIRVKVAQARQAPVSDAELQGLYISEEEVDALLKQPLGMPRWAAQTSPLSTTEIQSALDRMRAEINQRKAESVRRGVALRLDELAHLFNLTNFDVDVLLICLAPELDLRYERLYAYLQDDVTRKRPSVDLVLNLLCPSLEAKLAARECFYTGSPLLKDQLLHLLDDPSCPNPPLLNKCLKVDERIVNYLLDSDELDALLLNCAQHVAPQVRLEDLLLPREIKTRLERLSTDKRVAEKGLVLYFCGPYGAGKQTTAEALCRELAIGLLAVNGKRLLKTDETSFVNTVRRLRREALLQKAALYWKGFDALLVDDKQALREALVQALEEPQGLIFLSAESSWEPRDALHATDFLRIKFQRPDYANRLQLWSRSLNGGIPLSGDADLRGLAGKFRFTGGQIRDAANTAQNLARGHNPDHPSVTMSNLYRACRLQSNRKLAALAQKITSQFKWDDIVLPSDRLEQLQEICNTVKYRALVYEKWGFDRKLALGKGLNVLFAGPSGTGKTMAAGIMARELGLDLYKIDLSTVVSKYIGETEKNLARIFAEAETSNVILFFDEADALFGRRSEVRDSHDRYANIEISYLLQRMEEYESMVILATNFRKNMDDAFVRRMHFTIEFPFPAKDDRRRIWKQIWPDDTPRRADLDLDMDAMARNLEITGGNIRNIALAAAFLAADDGGIVNTSHLIRATQREYQKMGKVVMEGEFEKLLRPRRDLMRTIDSGEVQHESKRSS